MRSAHGGKFVPYFYENLPQFFSGLIGSQFFCLHIIADQLMYSRLPVFVSPKPTSVFLVNFQLPLGDQHYAIHEAPGEQGHLLGAQHDTAGECLPEVKPDVHICKLWCNKMNVVFFFCFVFV